MRRRFGPWFALLLLAPLLLLAGCEKGATAPRGLILISLDTLRADHVGFQGYERPTTPNLDRLAQDSIVFEQMLAPAPNTPPSHMSMFTGLLPVQHGFMGYVNEDRKDVLSEEHRTLPQLLQEQGFATGAFTGGGWVAGTSFRRGFDQYMPIPNLESQIPLEWLREHRDERFFLFLHSYEIHAPYRAAEQYRKLFVDPAFAGDFKPRPHVLKKVREGRRRLSDEEVRYAIDLYDAGIRQADARLGRFFDALAEDGILDETIVIVTSDHGEEFLEHDSVGHWQLFYRPNLHVPFLLRLPGGAEKGRRIEDVSEHIDILPTVLELLGLPAHPPVYGRSWASAVRGGPSPEPRPALAWSARPMEDGRRSVIADGHQLIVDTTSETASLYDLRADPTAQHDVAAAKPEVRDRLLAHWKEWESKEENAWPEDSEPFSPHLRRSLEALGYLEPTSP